MSHRPACRFDIRSFPAVAVIDAYGSVDDAAAWQLGAVVGSTGRAGWRSIVVNFGSVRRFGQIGLAAALDMCAAAARAGVTLKAVCPPLARTEVLVLAKLATCLELYPTEQEALAAFTAGAFRLPPPAPTARAA